MYGHNSPAYPRAADFHLQDSPAAYPFSQWAAYDHQGAAAEFSSNSCSSGSSSHAASPISHAGSSAAIQRSVSSHSLQKACGTHRLISDLLEMETGGPVRRVYSTGDLDLQGIANGGQQQQSLHSIHSYTRCSENSSLSSESSMIIEGMSKACRYSPEEKKERIERYRSKRNLRNFNKTIKYACRKTLADSRPRIRGRFARNDEIEKNSPVQWSQISGEEDEEDESWINLLDAFSSIDSNSLI